MPRKRPPNKDAEAICRRLNQFVHQRYGSWAVFEDQFGVARTTRIAWSRRKSPAVPEVAHLLRLARETNLNLNWLLLGEPPDVRVAIAQNPVEQFYAVIEAELRASEHVSPQDFQFAWEQIKAHSDIANQHKDTVVGLAVDGVRPVFHQMIQWVRQQDAFAKLWQAPEKHAGPAPPEASTQVEAAEASTQVEEENHVEETEER
jgi:hypothetical protein